MFLMFLSFVVVTASFAVLLWFGFNRIAMHLRGNPEATKAVVEHVLIPLFGRKDGQEFETLPDGTLKGFENNNPK